MQCIILATGCHCELIFGILLASLTSHNLRENSKGDCNSIELLDLMRNLYDNREVKISLR